jgi:hydrogenase/urease accessory protein HupE
MTCTNIRNIILTAFMVLVWPVTASAHLVNTGLGPFYDGISHLAMSPDDLLSAVALALLAGLNGARAGRAVLFLLPISWLLGGVFGLRMEQEVSLPVFSTLTFLITGVLVALDRKASPMLISGITCTFGFLHGFLNGSAMSQAGGGFLALFGVSLAAFVLVALQWARIVVRVAGSWITAIGLLMLGWAYRGMS